MPMHVSRIVAFVGVAIGAGWGCGSNPDGPSQTGNRMTFFVSSATSMTGNLGGLRGADATCQRLAATVGAGSRTWRAYLSVEQDPDNGNRPTDARSRIGNGPWNNAKGGTAGSSVSEVHNPNRNPQGFLSQQ